MKALMSQATLFAAFVELCSEVEKTGKRTEKRHLIASFLQYIQENEIVPVIYFLSGRPLPESDPRTLDVSGKTLWRLLQRSRQSTLAPSQLTVLQVYDYFMKIAEISGKSSRQRKEALVESLLGQANPVETEYIIRIIFGEMRIGVVEGVLLDAIAKAANLNLEIIRRSYLALGNLGEVARIALKQGREGLELLVVKLFEPVRPMLAETSDNLGDIIQQHGGKTALEYKLDGARIQIHRMGEKIRIFSRRLADVTLSLPDIVEYAKREVHASEFIVEGEAVAVGSNMRPLPFQDLMRRFRRVHDIDQMVKRIPLKLYLFDILYLKQPLVDMPYETRWKLLSQICEPKILPPRIITSGVLEGEKFLRNSLESGHEGLMAKDLAGIYTPGIRGKKWFKIKKAEYLDAVIIAADWGYGRRTGWLSNYHLAVKDEDTGKFLMIGKTFKGLTDAEFKEMTRKLHEIKTGEDKYTVYVKPKIVVEVAYNEIQKSLHYKSGFALRFARITRLREDKDPEDADTIGKVEFLFEKQFIHKARIIDR